MTARFTLNLCNDGHDAPCKNGQPGGLVSADAFLQKWIPLITASAAYQSNGLIVLIFDEGGLMLQPTTTGLSIFAPGLFCRNEQPGPNLAPFPQTTNITPTISLTFQSYGGDRTGAVLLSPYLEPGTVSNTTSPCRILVPCHFPFPLHLTGGNCCKLVGPRT